MTNRNLAWLVMGLCGAAFGVAVVSNSATEDSREYRADAPPLATMEQAKGEANAFKCIEGEGTISCAYFADFAADMVFNARLFGRTGSTNLPSGWRVEIVLDGKVCGSGASYFPPNGRNEMELNAVCIEQLTLDGGKPKTHVILVNSTGLRTGNDKAKVSWSAMRVRR